MCDAEYYWHEHSFRPSGALSLRLKAGEIVFFANRKSYFLSVISGYSVKKINSFHNNINKQFHMFMSVCL